MQPLLQYGTFFEQKKENSLNLYEKNSNRYFNSSISNSNSNRSNLEKHVNRNQLLIMSELIFRELCDEVIKSDFKSPSIPDVLYEVIKEMIDN
jgi:hypothetical protein